MPVSLLKSLSTRNDRDFMAVYRPAGSLIFEEQ
jgi:hypothetical protein